MTRTTQDFIDKAREVHGTKYDYSKAEYLTCMDKITIICKKHGEFNQAPNSHINQKSGCPKCKESTGERKISEVLDKLGLKYKRETRFPSCKNKITLRFDFLVKIGPAKGFLIEYNGVQHYKPTRWHEGIDDKSALTAFETTQARDAIKKLYCDSRKIPLLIIPYWKRDRIEQVIQDFIVSM